MCSSFFFAVNILFLFYLIKSSSKKSFFVLSLMQALLQSSQWMLTTVKFSFSSSLRLNFVVPLSKSRPSN